ncbi:cation diffusion facilitator family transporter [Anaerovorax sp. IOR16]|uniref:cation diffusion facilitator family transporter n=1 Tax=Anaerovorax sp. IOR16 TaxID=2773458 RepID=UPI0019D23E9A|nr:cation diffusion facilitator family transporter [Anaerovorax sp. IOR16]
MDISEKTALGSIIINLIIFAMKYAAAVASGSIALKAEAFHTLADFVASSTVFIGIKISKYKTKAFPYGLYKIENLLSVLISLIILYTGYEILLEVIDTTNTVVIRNSNYAILSLLLSIIITLCFSKYEKKVGQKTNSPILLADAAHIHMDVLSNGLVFIAMISSLMGYQVDKIAAIIVVGFIVRTGFQILEDGARVLLDASLDYDTLSKVEKIIIETPQVIELKTLTGRNSGRFKFIEANIVIKTHDLKKAHIMSEEIEKQIQEEIKNVHEVFIHYEPMQKEELIYAFPLTDDQNHISEHFGEAMSFMLITINGKDKEVRKMEVIQNPFSTVEKSKGILAAEYLVKNLVDFVIVKKDFGSKGPHYVFSNSNVEMILTDEVNPHAALKKIGIRV